LTVLIDSWAWEMPLYMLTAEKENAAILTGDSNFKGKIG